MTKTQTRAIANLRVARNVRATAMREAAKASERVAAAVRAAYRKGLSQREIAESVGISHQRVQQLLAAQR